MGDESIAQGDGSTTHQRRWLTATIRVVATGAFLYALFSLWSFEELLETLRSFDLRFLPVLFALVAVSTLIRAVNLQYLVRRVGAPLKFWVCFRIQMITYFLNSFVLFNVGGDIARFAHLKRRGTSPALSAHTIIQDRLTGVVGTFLFAAVCLSWEWPFAKSAVVGSLDYLESKVGLPVVFVVIAPVIVLALAVAFLVPAGRALLSRFRRFAEEVWATFRASPRHSTVTFVGSTGVTVSLQIARAAFLWFATMSVGIDSSWTLAGLVSAVAALVSMIPLTTAGLGIAELVIVYAYTSAGASPAAALAAALLARMYWLVAGTLGLVALLGERKTGDDSDVPSAPSSPDGSTSQ